MDPNRWGEGGGAKAPPKRNGHFGARYVHRNRNTDGSFNPGKFKFQARGFICTDRELWRPISDRFRADSHDDPARVTRESHASRARVAANRAHDDVILMMNRS